ncbi:sugar transporter permease, partial [Brucella canis]
MIVAARMPEEKMMSEPNSETKAA